MPDPTGKTWTAESARAWWEQRTHLKELARVTDYLRRTRQEPNRVYPRSQLLAHRHAARQDERQRQSLEDRVSYRLRPWSEQFPLSALDTPDVKAHQAAKQQQAQANRTVRDQYFRFVLTQE